MGLILAAGLAAVLVAGVVLLVVGWRGRKINDHPVCRGCGFDLVGVYPGVERCPECGAGLTDPGSVGIGVRRRRVGVLGAGIGLTVVGVGVSATLVIASSGANFNQYKPIWWLLWDARSQSSSVSDAAADELLTRFDLKGISASGARAIADAVLEMQSDPAFNWTQRWGDVFLTAASGDAMRVARFERQAVIPEPAARSRVRLAGPIPVDLGIVEPRLAPGRGGHVVVLMRDVLVNGRASRVRSVEASAAYGPDAWRTGYAVPVLPRARSDFGVHLIEVPSGVEPGPIEVAFGFAAWIVDLPPHMTAAGFHPLPPMPHEQELHWQTIRLDGIELVSGDSTAVASKGAQLTASGFGGIMPDGPMISVSRRRHPHAQPESFSGLLSGSVVWDAPVAGVSAAFAQVLRWPDGREQLGGFFTEGRAPYTLPSEFAARYAARHGLLYFGEVMQRPPFTDETGGQLPSAVNIPRTAEGSPTVVLRPCSELAELTTDVIVINRDEVVLGEIEVR